jgi:hypothetical protein
MYIPLTPLIICLVFLAVVALANITIIGVIAGGSRFDRSVGHAIEQNTAKQKSELCAIDCRCHKERSSMFPGMRCLDCFGEPCDEGTVEV